MILFCIIALALTGRGSTLDTVYEWSYIDYDFPDSDTRQEAIDSGEYDYTQCVVIDTDQAQDGRRFLTILKQDGVPASLVTITDQVGDGGPIVSPYPDWSWATDDCTGITGVFRINIDDCNRLWVLDAGVVGTEQVCPAQLLAFDLSTDELVEQIEIPSSVTSYESYNSGVLGTPMVETGEDCADFSVMLTAAQEYGLIVALRTDVWRVDSDIIESEPNANSFSVDGDDFVLNDGIVGMALTKKDSSNSSFLYFKNLESFNQYTVKSNDLKESQNNPVTYYKSDYKLPSQSTVQSFSSNGALFIGPIEENSLSCWHHKREFNEDNVVTVIEDDSLQFLGSLKVKEISGESEKVLMATNRLQDLSGDEPDFSEVNFRILEATVDELIADTNCLPPSESDEVTLVGFQESN